MERTCHETELQALRDLAHGGRDRALVVLAPAGGGKSTLLDAAAAAVGAAVRPTVTVRAHPAEADWPLSGLGMLLTAIDEVHATTHAETLLADAPLVDDAGAEPFHVATRLLTRLRDRPLAPTLVLVDDADRLDTDSRRVLGFLLRRLAGSGLRIACFLRVLEPDSPFGGLPALPLAPLRDETALDLARSSVPANTQESVLQLVVRRSGGLPLAVTSLLSRLTPAELNGVGFLPHPMRIGERLADTIRDRLATLDSDQVEALRILAGSPYTPDSVLERLSPDIRLSVEDLVAGHLVVRTRSVLRVQEHVVRSAFYWSRPAAERIALHRTLRDACAEDDAGLAAWHTSRCDPTAPVAGDLLRAAAALIGNGLVHEGVELAEQALAHRHEQEVTSGLLAVIAALQETCEYDLARRYDQAARRLCGGSPAPPALAVLSVKIEYLHRQELPRDLVRTTLDRFRDSDPAGCAELAVTASLCLLERWEPDAATALLREARGLPGSATPTIEAARIEAAAECARLYAAVLDGRELPPPDAIPAVLDRLRPLGDAVARLMLARTLSLCERYAEAGSLLEQLVTRGTGTPPVLVDLSRQLQLAIELRSGRLHSGRSLYEVLQGQRPGRRSLLVARALAGATIYSAEGAHDRAAAEILTAGRLVSPGSSPLLEAQVAACAGHLAVRRGDFEEAVTHLTRARELGGSLRNPQILRLHADLVNALVAAGDTTGARAVVDELSRLATTAPSRWTSLALAASEALLLDGEDSLRAHEELLREWTDPLYEDARGRTMARLAEQLQLAGHHHESRRARETAVQVLRGAGIPSSPLASARGAPGAAGAPSAPGAPGAAGVPGAPGTPGTLAGISAGATSPLAALTDTERQVAELVAEGAKNQAVAHQLYLSVRTVEVRLTSIYRKLGLRSRVDLARLVTAGPMAEGSVERLGSSPSTPRPPMIEM